MSVARCTSHHAHRQPTSHSNTPPPVCKRVSCCARCRCNACDWSRRGRLPSPPGWDSRLVSSPHPPREPHGRSVALKPCRVRACVRRPRRSTAHVCSMLLLPITRSLISSSPTLHIPSSAAPPALAVHLRSLFLLDSPHQFCVFCIYGLSLAQTTARPVLSQLFYDSSSSVVHELPPNRCPPTHDGPLRHIQGLRFDGGGT